VAVSEQPDWQGGAARPISRNMLMRVAPEIEECARRAATEVAGPAGVEGVEVEEGADYDDGNAIYRFTFLISGKQAALPMGMLRLRLLGKLRDDLLARDDQNYPRITLLDRADWERTRSA